MATSSITHNFVFSGESAERFIDAIEASAKDLPVKRKPLPGHFVTDPEEAMELLEKWEKKHNNKVVLGVVS